MPRAAAYFGREKKPPFGEKENSPMKRRKGTAVPQKGSPPAKSSVQTKGEARSQKKRGASVFSPRSPSRFRQQKGKRKSLPSARVEKTFGFHKGKKNAGSLSEGGTYPPPSTRGNRGKKKFPRRKKREDGLF